MLKYITGPDCYLTGWWFTDWVYLNFVFQLHCGPLTTLVRHWNKLLDTEQRQANTYTYDYHVHRYRRPDVNSVGRVPTYFHARPVGWGDNNRTLLPTNVKTLRSKHGRLFPDDILKWIFLNQNVWISIRISLKFVPRGPFNNMPALVQIDGLAPSRGLIHGAGLPQARSIP